MTSEFSLRENSDVGPPAEKAESRILYSSSRDRRRNFSAALCREIPSSPASSLLPLTLLTS
jgi:hypothetical protein